MKTLTRLLIAILLLTIVSCSDKKEPKAEMKSDEAISANYQCKMRCEGDKTYESHGSCPQCGMVLTKVSPDNESVE